MGRNVGNSGCSCGASTAQSPPPPSPPASETPLPFSPPIPDTDDPLPVPEPAATESCTVSGRWKKSECNGKPSGKCVFQKKGKRCLRTPSNGGKCTDYMRKTSSAWGP